MPKTKSHQVPAVEPQYLSFEIGCGLDFLTTAVCEKEFWLNIKTYNKLIKENDFIIISVNILV